uniref:death-associated protein 1 homolog n=1 Tax=Myxine glutinosa TaxID=7769 RepID=UPI00358F88E9
MTAPPKEDCELKGGRLPAAKAGGMRIKQKHPLDNEVVAEKESKDVQVLSSAPKTSIVISGALPKGNREFESAMQAVHNKPMPTVEKLPTARQTSQVIHQPRK